MLEGLQTADLGHIAEPKAPAQLRFARTCYDHLAGRAAVAVFDQFLQRAFLRPGGDGFSLTSSGEAFLASIGVDVATARARRRPMVRHCVDWTERRPHLAGSVGAGLLDAFLANGWVTNGRAPRSIRITATGRTQLRAQLGVDLT